MTDDQLRTWIAASTRNRRRLALALAAALPLDLALAMVQPRSAALGLFLLAIVAACGTWVLTSHIAGWNDELARRRARPKMSTPGVR